MVFVLIKIYMLVIWLAQRYISTNWARGRSPLAISTLYQKAKHAAIITKPTPKINTYSLNREGFFTCV